MQEADVVHMPGSTIDVRLPESPAPREPHAGDHGRGSNSTTSITRPAQASAPLFPTSNWIFGTFSRAQISVNGTGIEVVRGEYSEWDLTNGYLNTGEYESANVTRDVIPSKGMGGVISSGFFGGIGTAGGMLGPGSGASISSSGPSGGGSIGYSRSTPDGSGDSGYQGVSVSADWSPKESAGANVSYGETRIKPREAYNLNIEKHIIDWMNERYWR